MDELTVREMLEFYGTLKGVPPHELKRETDKLLVSTHLTHKQHELTASLSGGTHRFKAQRPNTCKAFI